MVVGIAEPCPLRREALRRALRALGCPDLRELPLSLAGPGWREGEEDLEVVLLAFRVPAGNGLGLYAALRRAHRPVRGVVLVEDPGPPHWGLAGRLGLAVLAYSEAAGEVLRRAVRGQWAMSPAARSAGAAWWAGWGARWEGLSRMQRAIAWGIARGWSDPEIAQALSIRRSTLRTHLRRLFARLGLPGRQALRAWLRAGGLEDPAVAAGLRGEAPWPPVAGDPDGRAMSPLLEDTLRICPPFWRTTASAGWIE